MKELIKDILINPYKNYIYSYPHKKSYREFDKPIELRTLWEGSDLENLTLYVHIPFCMNKCGYCNLFSSTCYDESKLDKYVEKLIEEIKAVKIFLNLNEKKGVFSNVIFGGGTPTVLGEFQLRKLLEGISNILNIDFQKTFFSTETSPRTLTGSKLEVLKAYHIDRISMGIQSFKQEELKNIYRSEPIEAIKKSLKLIFDENIPIRNLDLIYGIPFQTMETWQESLENILKYKPEDIFIYPIYIREKTGLYLKYKRDVNLMVEMYEYARDFLKDNNYIQTSMRNFIRADMKDTLFPEYNCQENKMIGVGCGSRSYIDNVHYSRKYGVDQKNINKIIEDYINEEDFSRCSYGYILNEDELKRRYILKSILKATGLDKADYINKFKVSPVEEFQELSLLMEHGFLFMEQNRVCPTEKGLMHSDAMGQLFISADVTQKICDFHE